MLPELGMVVNIFFFFFSSSPGSVGIGAYKIKLRRTIIAKEFGKLAWETNNW